MHTIAIETVSARPKAVEIANQVEAALVPAARLPAYPLTEVKARKMKNQVPK